MSDNKEIIYFTSLLISIENNLANKLTQENNRVAEEFYDKLFNLRNNNYDLYYKIIETLNILKIDDFMDSRKNFLDNITSFISPHNPNETLHNLVIEFKSEDSYYKVNSVKTSDNPALEFLLQYSSNIKLFDMGILIGAAISGILNEEFKLLQEEGNLNGNQLWENICKKVKSFSFNFDNIDCPDFNKAIYEQNTDKVKIKNTWNNIKCFFDEKTKTIYPIITVNVENIEDQEIQYFEKMALLNMLAHKNEYKIVEPLVFTRTYFNEHFDGHDVSNEFQQHSTNFLNSFKPPLTKTEKNKLNASIIFSLFSKITIPNSIHKNLDINDFCKMNIFSSGSDTKWIYDEFQVIKKLNSPLKERTTQELLLNNINDITEILAKTSGLNCTDKTTKTILSNLNNMIKGLNNFNLSNIKEGDSSIYHLNTEDIKKLLEIGKNLKKINEKSKGFETTDLYENNFMRFKDEDHIMDYLIQFYEKMSEKYDYQNMTGLKNKYISSQEIYEKTIIKLNNTTLKNKIKDILYANGNINETGHFSYSDMTDLIIQCLSVKEAYPETPIASLSAISNNSYQNIKKWNSSKNTNDRERVKIIKEFLNIANNIDPIQAIDKIYNIKLKILPEKESAKNSFKM
jgi:hypothetical protein